MPKILFLDYGISRSETPQRLFQRLQEDIGARAECARNQIPSNPTRTAFGILHPTDRRTDVIIRWGTGKWPELDSQAAHVLNRNFAIQFNLNKKNAHRKMMEDRVNVPPFWETISSINSYPALRRRQHHMRGTDIVLFRDRNEALRFPRSRRTQYYVKLINKEKEYRLHMFKGECVGMAEKMRPSSGTAGRSSYIWNHENGWEFNYIPREDREEELEGYDDMVEQSAKALEALELDFGSVDLVLESGTHTPYVLEVNTAPSLHTTNRFSNAIIKWLREENIIPRRRD